MESPAKLESTPRMALTSAEISAVALPKKGKLVRLRDDDGLYLEVRPTGTKTWYVMSARGGKQRTKALGEYPGITIAAARKMRAEFHMAMRLGDVLPSKRAASAEPETVQTFKAVALRWHTAQLTMWKPNHASDVLASLTDDVFPKLGGVPIDQIKPSDVLEVVRAIEPRSVDIARRTRQRIRAVFQFAIAESICDSDPSASIVKAMRPHIKEGRRPAIISLDGARKVLADVEEQPGHPATKLAHRLLALTAVRPGEARAAEWVEFEGLDGESPVWRVPARRMKMKLEHVVPLSPAAVEVIEAARKVSGDCAYVFPMTRNSRKPISENAIGFMLIRAGYADRHVPHGWRSTFSSVMNERHRADGEVIELMLAHVKRDRVAAAYNRAEHMERRRELANEWAALIMAGAVTASELLGGPRR